MPPTMGRWIVAPAGNRRWVAGNCRWETGDCRFVLRADSKAATAQYTEHVVALTGTGVGNSARKCRSIVVGPTTNSGSLWRTRIMQLVYWFINAYESLVTLIRIGMEG